MTAVGILVVVFAISGTIFRVAVTSHRMAAAHAEILQKLRTITQQLDVDFEGLRKDGEICIVWDNGGGMRRDRMVFFADGHFCYYNGEQEGFQARISYMLANRGQGDILSRTQHILPLQVASDQFFPDPAGEGSDSVTVDQFNVYHNHYEYQPHTLKQWKEIDPEIKARIIEAIMDVNIVDMTRVNDPNRGTLVDLTSVSGIQGSIHKVLCEGVGQFMIQGWYEEHDPPRWIPQDSDFSENEANFLFYNDFLPTESSPENPVAARVHLGGGIDYTESFTPEAFNAIPGLGRALRFTFTLYDSKGLIQGGRTYSHIVYLDK
jgi:hypothetical protein